ncbi:MAG: hypothetical protein ABIG61_05780, partial [Planctomycetota bacterium]
MANKLFRTNLVGVGRRLSLYDLRALAQNEPKDFIHKVNVGVESGKLKLEDIRDWKGLHGVLADVQVPVTMEMAGSQRAIMASAFPILTGTLAIAAINEAYQGVPSIGQELVTDFEDNKKVTTIAAVHSLDKQVDEVKETMDFPEIGVDEEKVEIRHKRNGRRLTISAEAIEENEAADIVTRINALGEIAGEWIEEQTLARVTDHYGSGSSPAEPYVYRPAGTGTQLYSATANTPGTRAPSGTRVNSNALVDETDLDAVRTVLRAMKNARGKRINIPWSEVYFLVPDAIEGTLMKIINSELVPGVENEVSNWGPRGKYYIPLNRVLSSPKMDDLSTSAWYVGAFKRQFKRK